MNARYRNRQMHVPAGVARAHDVCATFAPWSITVDLVAPGHKPGSPRRPQDSS